MNSDPYVYPGTTVLKNNVGIRDPEDLEQTERLLSALSIREPFSPSQPLTPEGYQAIHRRIFREIYPWAGEFRTCELGKPAWFEEARNIKARMEGQFAALKAENGLQGLSRAEFADRAAEHICQLNDIHPFREGNGRTNRIFLQELATRAGHDLRREFIDAKAWQDASKLGFNRNDFSLMSSVIGQAIEATRAQQLNADLKERLRSAPIRGDQGREDHDR